MRKLMTGLLTITFWHTDFIDHVVHFLSDSGPIMVMAVTLVDDTGLLYVAL